MSADTILDGIIRREGTKYTDHAADRGGPTKYGITQQALTAWRGKQVTPYEVAALTRDEALAIYRSRYVRPFEFISDARLLELVVDCGVNHGVNRAIKWMQAAAGTEVDGFVGPATRAAVAAKSPAVMYAMVLALRARFYGRIITNDPTQAVFAAGWMNRLAGFIVTLG